MSRREWKDDSKMQREVIKALVEKGLENLSITSIKISPNFTFFNKCSTNENPIHQNCPASEGNWCKAETKGERDNFYDKPL